MLYQCKDANKQGSCLCPVMKWLELAVNKSQHPGHSASQYIALFAFLFCAAQLLHIVSSSTQANNHKQCTDLVHVTVARSV